MWHCDPQQTQFTFDSRIDALLAAYADPLQPAWVARAPGRLDVMGGIADYSGSLVLQLPLDVSALALVQPRSDGQVVVVSRATELQNHFRAQFSASALTGEYAVVYNYLRRQPQMAWAAYMAGVLPVLAREANLHFPLGMTIVVDSSVPLGKGVSSSAAVEVATMRAVLAMANYPCDGRTLAIWSQMVENHIVGAPCGIMDQMTSACGRANQLLALRCQPAELLEPVVIPADLMVWGIDSGVRHAVSGADYGSVRIGAFMGYRIIADITQTPVTITAGRAIIADTRWGGYLANLTPSEFVQSYADSLPLQMSGADFVARYGATSDAITTIDPQRIYAVRQPTYHPIAEHHRVRTFGQLLAADTQNNQVAELLGELMYQSHASYSACGLGSAATDAIVAAVRALGPAHGLFGAKITGGGSGGTVAVLGRPDAVAQIHHIAQIHGSGLVFAGSSDGAAFSPVGCFNYT
jgi:galactokinase